jgi:TonB family protein
VELPEHSRQLIREWLERELSVNANAEVPEILDEGLEGRSPPPAMPASLPMPVMHRPTPSEPVPFERLTEMPAAVAPPSEGELHPESHTDLKSHEAETAELGSLVEVPAGAIGDLAPDQETQPVFSFQRDSFRASTVSSRVPDRWSVAVFFLFLATASLAAGWAVGRGALAGAMEALRRAVFREGTAGGAVASSPAGGAQQARPSEIEIVNLKGDRWSVPLTTGSTSPLTGVETRQESALPSSSPSSSSPSTRRKDVPFRTWVLTAPLQPKSGDVGPAVTNSEAAPPPAVGTSIGPPQGALPSAEQPPTIPAPLPPKQSVVRPAQLLRRVDPVYPQGAISRRVEGTVKMHIAVSANGTVQDVQVISGPPLLTDAAAQAARKWLYSPMTLDGKPTDSTVDISVAFHLP